MDFRMDEYLLAISGLALALAGFTSVISAFRPTGKEYLPQEIEGIKLILHTAFTTTLFSLLPFLTIHSFETPIAAWIICKLSLIIVLILGLYIHSQNIKELRSKATLPRREKGLIFFILFTVFMVSMLILSTLNSCSHDAYFWTLMWMLFMGGSQFFVFVSEFKPKKNQPCTQVQNNNLNKKIWRY